MATSYNNLGGRSDRTAIITVQYIPDYVGVNDPIDSPQYSIESLINGITVSSSPPLLQYRVTIGSAVPVANTQIIFDFGSNVLIDEATWYQSVPFFSTHGIWKWQGSTNGISYSDIGNSFGLGSTDGSEVHTELNGNTTSYRYYRLLGVSGSIVDASEIYEVEFKIDGMVIPTPGPVHLSGVQLSGVSLSGASRPTWVKHGDTIVIADGGPPVKISAGVTSLLGGSPRNFRKIIKLGSYHLGIGHDDTELMWSAANNIENWTTGDSGFANVTKNGIIKNAEALRNRAVIFKNNEIEVWFNRGGALQFVPVETIEKGIFGKGDSLVKETNALYFLGDDRRFYRLDGINTTPISSPMESYIQSLVDPDSCYGFNCNMEHVIRWMFPADGVMLVYDYKNSSPERPIWWEENIWEHGQFERMPFASYMEINNKQYFGSFNLDGLIYEWSKDHLDDNGLPIREFRHFSIKGGEKRVRFNELTFLLKRGVATATVAAPKFMWRFKLDRATTWSAWDELDMGAVGDTDPFIKRRNLGIGRIVEFQIAQSDAVDTFLMEMALTAREMRS